MADRFPAHPRSKLDASTQQYYDRFSETADAMFEEGKKPMFITKRPSDGALVGPFPFFLEQPESGEAIFNLYGKIAQIPGLPPDAREVVILAVGAKFKSAYELYAHVNVAVKKTGIPQHVAEAIARGERPADLKEDLRVAYDAASHLAGTPGALPQDLWDQCIKTFGKDGTIKLVHYAGSYAYTCIVLNAIDASVPKESD